MSDTSSSSSVGSSAGSPPPSYSGAVPEKETTAYKAAKMAVIVLSSLIILAVIALIAGAVFKLAGKTPDSALNARPASTASFQLPAGATIVSMDTQPGRLILRVREGGAEEIDIIDIANGHLVVRIKANLAPATSPGPNNLGPAN